MSFSNFEFPNTNFYDSDLRELIAMYKKLSSEYSTIKSEIDEAVNFINNFKPYVSEIIADELKNSLDIINARFDVITEALKRIDLNIDDIENNIITLENDIKNAKNEINNSLIAMKLDITRLYETFEEYKHNIDNIIQAKLNTAIDTLKYYIEEVDRLFVVNPLTGEYTNIQDVLDMICNYLTVGYGLTASEYDSLNLSAIKYDNMRLTALMYSMRGFLIFFKRLKETIVNPFTGDNTTYDVVINMLANLHKNSYTADEFDALLLVASDYDSKAVSAYNFDWNSKAFI